MSLPRPAIPEPVKREVRKRCFFGCVLCGSPVFQYDHMIEYSVVKEHNPDNITLLCPNHHNEKTVNRLSLARVERANAAPANATAKTTGGHEMFFDASWNTFKFIMGDSEWHMKLTEGELCQMISIDQGPVLAVKLVDGVPLLRVSLRDADNRTLLRIQNNELTHALHKWDVEFVSQVLTIWNASRDIGLVVVFEEGAIRIVRGKFYANGYQFKVDYPVFRVGGIAFERCYSDGPLVGGIGAKRTHEYQITLHESQRGPGSWF